MKSHSWPNEDFFKPGQTIKQIPYYLQRQNPLTKWQGGYLYYYSTSKRTNFNLTAVFTHLLAKASSFNDVHVVPT